MHKMFKKTVFLLLSTTVLAQKELLDSLYGQTGANKLTLCAEEVECEGALWKVQWVVTRSGCLSDVPLYKVAVMKGKQQGCENYVKEIVRNTARKIRVRFPHPDPEQKIDLLFLDVPYNEVEPLVNDTRAHELLKQYEPWMQRTIRSYQPKISYVNPYARRSGAFSSPVRMFVTTVVLPSAAFIVFFLFIMFFTSPKNHSAHRDYSLMKETNDV